MKPKNLVYDVASGTLFANGNILPKKPSIQFPSQSSEEGIARFCSALHYGIIQGTFSVNENIRYFYSYTYEKWYDHNGTPAPELKWWF